jgi:hypothetical protein
MSMISDYFFTVCALSSLCNQITKKKLSNMVHSHLSVLTFILVLLGLWQWNCSQRWWLRYLRDKDSRESFIYYLQVLVIGRERIHRWDKLRQVLSPKKYMSKREHGILKGESHVIGFICWDLHKIWGILWLPKHDKEYSFLTGQGAGYKIK